MEELGDAIPPVPWLLLLLRLVLGPAILVPAVLCGASAP